jgi:hypothetical protein
MKRLLTLTTAMLAFPLPAHAGDFLTNAQFVGLEGGKPVSAFRADGAVRFDPFAAELRTTGDAQSSEEPAFRQSYALPLGGDVDGDAREDVLEVDLSFDSDGAPVESVFVARSGDDGNELWRTSLGAGIRWGGYLPGDTTGDARPDVAFTTLEDVQFYPLWPPPGLACFDCYKWALTGTTRLVSLDGASGEFRWQHERQVVWAFQEQPVLPLLVRNWAYASALSAFAALPDLNGDGGRELLWTPWTSTYTEALTAQSTQTAEAIAYDGRGGREQWDVKLQGAGATPWNRDTTALAGAWPGPDATGDGVPDVYTSEIVETPLETLLTRKGIDGVSGEQVWSQNRSWVSDARPLRASYLPLGGGGLVYTLTGNDFRSDVEALDPATGAVRWAQLGREALFVLPAGDLDKDGREDLASFGYDQSAQTVSLEGIDGATGETRSRRVLEAGQFRWLYVLTPFFDHSGDGVVDPLLFAGRSTASGVDEQVTVTDLAKGSELWGSLRTGGDVPTYWLPASDFDGKGEADVLAVRLHDLYADPQPRIELQAMRGPNGRALWWIDPYRTGPAGETIWSVYLGFMRDANGKRGDDFQISSWNLYGSWGASVIVPQVDLVDGRKGKPYLRLLG